MLFGAKSERFIPEQAPGQLSLFGSSQPQAEAETPKEVKVGEHRRQAAAKGQPKRLALPEHLERRVTTLEPDVDTSGMEKIGEEVSETLEYEPAKLVVHRIIRPKYVPKEGKNDPDGCKVHIAALPMRPIERCMAAATLLAIICIEKYIDHLPLHRQRMRYRRLGMDFPSSTICGWVAQVAVLLEILYDKLVDLVLQSQYLQVDETTIRVLQRRRPKNRGSTLKPKKGKTHLGYYWAFYDVNKGLLFFRYDKTRQQTVPYSVLKDFEGVIQVDGYAAYEGIDLIYNIVLVNCWAHARRKFDQALGNDQRRASYVLIQLQKLYELEQQARKLELDAEARGEMRRQKAKPIVIELFEWLEQESLEVLPKSPIGMALSYTLKRKEALMRYLHDGQLEIDNNLVENAMRPIALGRKNYLFAGSHDAAQRGAIFYSLFECCRQHEVDPYEWLVDVLNRLPAHPVNRVEELLPHLWKPLNNEAT
jgi:transposase